MIRTSATLFCLLILPILAPATTHAQSLLEVFGTTCLSAFPDYQAGAAKLSGQGFSQEPDGTWKKDAFLVNPVVKLSSGGIACSASLVTDGDPKAVVAPILALLQARWATEIKQKIAGSGRKATFEFMLGGSNSIVKIDPFLKKGASVAIFTR
jgi:hypothetical protein